MPEPPILWTFPQLAEWEFPFPEFYVEPLLTPDSTALLYGPREAGKTQFMMTMIRTIQEGGLFMGRFRCTKCRVALIEVDMPTKQLQMRVRTAQEEFKFDTDIARVYSPHSLNLLTATKDTKWVQAVRDFDPQVVMYDSLRKIHKLKENDAESANEVYSRAKELFPDVASMFAHHVTKTPQQAGVKEREAEDRFRGNTAWLDDADAGLYLSKKRGKRFFQVTRGRHCDDATKEIVTPVRLNEDSLFMEPGEPTPEMRLLEWRVQFPNESLSEAVEWLRREFPDRSKQTYYNWAHHVGYTRDKV